MILCSTLLFRHLLSTDTAPCLGRGRCGLPSYEFLRKVTLVLLVKTAFLFTDQGRLETDLLAWLTLLDTVLGLIPLVTYRSPNLTTPLTYSLRCPRTLYAHQKSTERSPYNRPVGHIRLLLSVGRGAINKTFRSSFRNGLGTYFRSP